MCFNIFLGPFTALLWITRVLAQTISIIERKFQHKKTVKEDQHFIISLLDRVVSNQSVKEQVFAVNQTTISKDWKPMSVFTYIYIYIKLKVFQFNALYSFLTLMEKLLHFNHKHVVQIIDPKLVLYLKNRGSSIKESDFI